MKAEKPFKKTTLVLTASFQPVGFFTARSAIHNLIGGTIRAVDATGQIYKWDEWLAKGDFSEDHPSISTVNREFPIPTIVTIPGFFGNYNKAKKKFARTSSLRQIFNLYDGVCQYCLKEIRFSTATKDHVVPKSKGGSNQDSNIVLACKKCNNRKASHFPYFDVEGKEVNPRKGSELDYYLKAERIEIRPEWELFLSKK